VTLSRSLLKMPAASASKTITIDANRKWLERDAIPHVGAIVHLFRPMHTENNPNRALGPCLRIQPESDSRWEKNYVDEIMRRM
jgi:hypothetical protein